MDPSFLPDIRALGVRYDAPSAFLFPPTMARVDLLRAMALIEAAATNGFSADHRYEERPDGAIVLVVSWD